MKYIFPIDDDYIDNPFFLHFILHILGDDINTCAEKEALIAQFTDKFEPKKSK